MLHAVTLHHPNRWRSADRCEQRVLRAAVARDIPAARNGAQVAAKADAGLLNVAVAAGDGDAIRLHAGIGLQKRLFDHGGGQSYGLVEFAKDRRAHDAVIGLADRA